MNAVAEMIDTRPKTGRSFAARLRAHLARATLTQCRLCAHDCGVNRLAHPAGKCHASAEPRIFSAQTELTDEVELIPTYAIALSGCDLRCVFCITGRESWDATQGWPFDAGSLAVDATAALRDGAASVMLLGGEPSVHLPAALEFIAHMPDDARLIWKTNGHASAQAREFLDGMFDTWVVDFKFGNDACAQLLAGVANYGAVVRENLRWAAAKTELIVRHLLMPGHLDCCWRPVAHWLAAELPDVKVNLRDGFWPAWQSRRRPELLRGNQPTESRKAFDLAHDLGLRLIL